MAASVRIRSLDGLRGLCALTVVLFHWWLLSPSAWDVVMNGAQPMPGSALFLLTRTPANLALAGSAAVMVFFVMSGAVLALTFTEVDKSRYIPYALKRFCRIYLPYIVAVLLSLMAMHLVRPEPIDTLSVWFNTYAWVHPITPLGFVNYLAMTNRDVTLNPAIWSLAHELRISLVFPLLIFCLLRWRLPTLVAVTALSLGARVVETQFHVPLTGQLWESVTYLYLFAFGAALYLSPVRLTEGAAGWQPRSLVLWLLALTPIFLSFQVGAMNQTIPAFVLSGVGAVLIVALALSANPVSDRVLASGWAVWLGRISYSLYLIHIPVLLTLVHLFHGEVPTPILFVVGSLGAILLAWVMAATLERSSQRLGRWLAGVYLRGTLRAAQPDWRRDLDPA